MPERPKHLFEDGEGKRLVVLKAEFADDAAHGASVEQAECHAFRQMREQDDLAEWEKRVPVETGFPFLAGTSVGSG
jgi:hypothetical protein